MLYSGKNSLSREASLSSIRRSTVLTSKKETSSILMDNAARKVYTNLTDVFNFNASSTPRKNDDLRSMNDSGFSDASLESWRLQAENTVIVL